MIIEVAQEKVFIPKWNKNDELPESEQIKVTHRFLKAGERKKYIYLDDIKVTSEGKVSDDGRSFHQDEQGLVKALVKKIENLSISVNGKVTDVKNADMLYETVGVPTNLVAEIEAHMLTASPEVDKDFL
jgi:hypothetical protein